MGGKHLHITVETFRNFVASRGWYISEEKAIQYGYQLLVTDGMTKTPVCLYSSGKAVVQGKKSPLQAALKAWCYTPQSAFEKGEPLTQLQFDDIQTISANSPTRDET